MRNPGQCFIQNIVVLTSDIRNSCDESDFDKFFVQRLRSLVSKINLSNCSILDNRISDNCSTRLSQFTNKVRDIFQESLMKCSILFL